MSSIPTQTDTTELQISVNTRACIYLILDICKHSFYEQNLWSPITVITGREKIHSLVALSGL